MRGLTQKQRAVIGFMLGYFESAGMWPTVRELGKGLGIGSTNGVIDHLRRLEAKGHVARGEPCVPRNWSVVKDADGRRVSVVVEVRTA